MSVIVAAAYMDEAQGFGWLVAMDEGRIIAEGTPQQLLARTGEPNLDDAFIRLVPPSQAHRTREGHRASARCIAGRDASH
jgi:ribosome-dependent ATPase